MKKMIAILMLIVAVSFDAAAQDFSAYEKKQFINGIDTLNYRLLLPLNYDASKKYPVILFLHGAGERGNDNEAQLVHGGTLFLNPANREKYPAIIIFPQCAANDFWIKVNFNRDTVGSRIKSFYTDSSATKSMALVEQMFAELVKTFPVKTKQIYVAGLSMGGMGTFDIVRRHPNLFAAAMPICGGANPATAATLKKTAWWIFHGSKDNIVDPLFSRIMADALIKEEADVKLTLYPDAGHNSWDAAFAETDFLPWLFSKHK